MILADTHAHLYLGHFDDDRDRMIRNALDFGVEYMLLPNIDRDSIPSLLSLADSYPGNCFPMMGLHPTSVKSDWEAQLQEVKKWFGQRKFWAVGEVGIDLYWDKTFQKEQESAFREQIRLARKYGLPIVIHTRNSFKESVAVLEDEKYDGMKGVFHCFSGTVEEAREAIGLGFMLGIGGVLTYKKSGLDEVVKEVGMEHLLLETDAPFLPPVPHRGERNESAWVLFVAQKLALVKDLPVEEVARITTENARKLFSLP
jgi:TatD DNase family protein